MRRLFPLPPVLRRRRAWAALAVALLAALLLWGAWRAWLAPTRVALVHYPDFQAARLVQKTPGVFTRVEVLPLTRLTDARRYDLVLLFGRGLKLDDAQTQQLRAAGAAGAAVYVDSATNPQHDALTTLRGPACEAIAGYLRGGGPANYARLQTWARRVLDGKRLLAGTVQPALPAPQDVFFHLGDEAVFRDFEGLQRHLRQRPDWQPGRPRLALLTSVPGPFNANRDHVDAAIRAFEARGLEVVPIAATRQRLALLRQAEPAAVVYLPHGRLAPGQPDEAAQWLAARNVPLFAPLAVFAEERDWLADPRGLDGGLLTMSVTLPELDGATTPMVVAAQARNADGLRVFRALPERLARFAELVQRTVALKTTANAQKKLAIYYYKGPGQSALTASGLEVVPSLYALLRQLRQAGYRVDGLPEDEAAFARLLQRKAPNIAPYAKGDQTAFLRDADPAWVPAAQLQGWCGKAIVQALCDQMAAQFGPAPGTYLSDGARVAVARLQLGNVVLLPQPLAGVGGDTFKIVHGTQTAPPWPYVASYLWARETFGADALLHFGTHGSLEFTPRKQVALSDLDWPDALAGGLPHVYLYTVANVGEAMVAKRRSYATTVSHLTPPLREGDAAATHRPLAARLQAWSDAASPALRHQYALDIQRQAVALGLHQELKLDPAAPWSDAQLHQLADHVESVDDTRTTAGLYTLGTPYPRAALDATVRLVGLDTVVQALAELDVARGTVQRLQLEQAGWLARTYRPRAEALVARAARGESADSVLAQVLKPGEVQAARGQATARPVQMLRTRLQTLAQVRDQLAASPARELAALTNALAGGFTPPSAGGDPLINPAALPTGRNLFAIDAEKAPTEQAWAVGRQQAERMLALHRAAHGGQWPTKVALTLWAGDFIHTEGATLAQVFYLLGVAPVRDPAGRVAGLRLIPRQELGRPRIDVVVQTSGQLRDLAGSRLALVNQAVAMAAQAREDDNAVAHGVQAVERALKERGASPAQARRMAGVRVFGGVDGNYGSGVMGMVEAGDRWQERGEVARTYLANMGAAYGEGDLWGAYQEGAFEAALAGTQVVVQPLESNTWGPLSLDHVYEFMGGLNLAVREVTGREPAAYFSDHRNPARPTVREAGAAIAADARASLLAPDYIRALTAGGASSGEVFAETFRNLYGWNVMKADAVAPGLWDALHDTYVRDAQHLGLHDFFERRNPYALQEMTAVMLETARKGYWQPGAARLQELALLHADLVARHGASGTGFVNDNRALRAFIGQQLAPAQRKGYDDALQTANQGAAVNAAGATVLRKEDTVAAPTTASGKPAPQPRSASTPATPSPTLRVGPAALAVLATAAATLVALVLWLRRRQRQEHR